MLKKEYRLKSNSAFIGTYKQNRVVSDEFFILYGGRLKNSINGEVKYPAKLGFVVSKKIHKRAVKRNRIKRLMRESCRLGIKNRELEEINNYVSLVFVAREASLGLIGLGLNETKKSMTKLIERLARKIV